MIKKQLKIIVSAVLALMLVFGVAMAGAATGDEAKLVFSGVTMKACDDGTVQGWIDVKLVNVKSAGVGFTFEYDSSVVELSSAADNSDITSAYLYGKSFEANKKTDSNPNGFMDGTFYTSGRMTSSAGRCKVDYKIMVLDSAPTAASGNTNIEETDFGDDVSFDGTHRVINADGKTVVVGRLSFKILDPEEFAKKSSTELKTIFGVATDESGASAFNISYVDYDEYPPVAFYDTNSHLDVEFAVENSIQEVVVDKDGAETNAAIIYNKDNADHKQDLIDWLNKSMLDVTVKYVDGTKIASNITWDITKAKILPSYDVKGGTYTVTQKFNDDIDVVATVVVKPVTLLGYTCDTEYLYKHYADPTAIGSGTDHKTLLTLPTVATAVFDTVVPGKTEINPPINDDWAVVDPSGNSAGLLDIRDVGTNGVYVYMATVGTAAMPWATIPVTVDNTVSVKRALGPVTPDPEFDVSVDKDGWLTISNIKVDGYSDLSGFKYYIVLPGGLQLNQADYPNTAGGGYFQVSADGTEIKLKAEDMSKADQQLLRQAINLGKKLGQFALAAEAPDKPQSDWVPFAADPRDNYYVGTGADKTGKYTFDYYSIPTIFAISSDKTAPPTTIALPMGDTVAITYSGDNGDEPGALSTIKVDSWTADKTAPYSVGDKVMFTGKLTDGYLSPEHGTIHNDATAPIYVSIYLRVIDPADVPEEKINDIEDIVFSKMQVGYTTPESRDVVIENIGADDIAGLTVTIAPNDAKSAAAFTMQAIKPFVLVSGDKITCTIERNLGLAVGSYSAVVTIGSNLNAELKKFNVSVEIVADPVYKVNVVADPVAGGTVKLPNGDNYCIGDTVDVVATPDPDYTFAGWEEVTGFGVVFDDATKPSASFTMLDPTSATPPEITVKAKFEPGPAAVLRLQELHLYNPDKSENPLLAADGSYKKATFEPLQRNYTAVAPNDADKNRAEFKYTMPTDVTVDISATLTVATSADMATATPVAVTIVQDSVDQTLWYIDYTDLPLQVMPTINRLTITLTRDKGTADELSKSYVVDIMRKIAVADMGELGYGNSPFGLIMRDPAVSTDTLRQEWKQKFVDEGNRFVAGYTPADGHQDIVYHMDAWGIAPDAADAYTDNLDRNDYALFVYSGENFSDPGITNVVNSLGESVASSDITRKIYDMVKLDDTAANLVDKFKNGKTYDVTFASGTTSIDKGVRPGVYELVYEFEDYDGSTAKITRPLVVLYDLGDVNMNNAVNDSDAQSLQGRFDKRLPYEDLPGLEPSCLLYRYRICDVNRDRNINIGDRNLIHHNATLTEFYK